MAPLRLYLRNRETRLFYAGSQQWHASFVCALSFETFPAAQRQAAADRLDSFETVLVDGAGRPQVLTLANGAPAPQPVGI